MERALAIAIVAAPILSGCTAFDDARLEGRLRRMARSAYAASPGSCNGVLHSVDYAKGFEEGYYDVASGGDGCPPALPPKKYWSAAYASPLGREHIEAWFQGFRDGAAAARADGAASYGVLHIAAEHRIGPPKPPMAIPVPPPPAAAVDLPPNVEVNPAGPPPRNPPERSFPTLPLPSAPMTTPALEAPTRSKTPPPLPTPPATASTGKAKSADPNGWRKAASAPSPNVVNVEFKQPPSEARPPKPTSDEAGWRSANADSVRLNALDARPLSR